MLIAIIFATLQCAHLIFKTEKCLCIDDVCGLQLNGYPNVKKEWKKKDEKKNTNQLSYSLY